MRLTLFPDLFEAVLTTVLGQQVSLAAARAILARLVAAYGLDTPLGRAFPTPHRLLTADPESFRETIGVPTARARTARAVAELFAASDPPGLDRLQSLPGIGPWTIQYVAIRGLGHPDVFPLGDAVLRRALARLTGPTDVAAWSPYRSYAAMRLWTIELGASGTGRR